MDDDLAALARCEGWTEERHAEFLDRVEHSFVQQVVLVPGGSDVCQASRRLGRRALPQAADAGGGQLPLDRPLPDSAVESNRAASSRRKARGK